MNADRTTPSSPHYRPPSLRESCAPSGGANGQDARSTFAESVRDCRLSAGQRTGIRVRSRVGVTGGYVSGASAKRERKPNPAWKPSTPKADYGSLDWS